MYNGGYTVRIKSDNSSHVVGKAQYVSTGFTYKFRLLGSEVETSATLFNILALFGDKNSPEFARYIVNGKVNSIKLPTTGMIRININVGFGE
jgi:hypothetical protein